MVRQLPRLYPLREGDLPERRLAATGPPGSGKDPDSRWIDIHEGELDEEQMAAWVRQSAALPGWPGF